MKARGKNVLLLLTGMLVGLILAPTAANAVSQYLTATPSTQTFYVDGQQVELEAYAINGHNYVKLRDVGQAVGFNVCYDPARNAAIMEPDKPYTGEDVTAVPSPSPQPADSTDYAAQANPGIFTGNLTRGVYNAFRDAVLHRDDILAGTFQPRSMGTSKEVDTATALRLVRRISGADINYSVVDAIDGSAEYLTAKYDDDYAAAAAHVRPFLDSISNLPKRDQVREMIWYIADRMTYNVKIKNLPSQILAQDGIMEDAGNCSTYSSALQFLCDQAGIPCILVDSDTHQWDAVYLDGAWWQVDPTANKGNIQTMAFQEYVNGVVTEVQKSEAERTAILQDTRDNLTVFYQELEGDNYVDEQPEITQFLKEVLVPGSTK